MPPLALRQIRIAAHRGESFSQDVLHLVMPKLSEFALGSGLQLIDGGMRNELPGLPGQRPGFGARDENIAQIRAPVAPRPRNVRGICSTDVRAPTPGRSAFVAGLLGADTCLLARRSAPPKKPLYAFPVFEATSEDQGLLQLLRDEPRAFVKLAHIFEQVRRQMLGVAIG
jgi:hypothetical protein